MQLGFRPTFRRVELAMLVRVLTGFLVILVLVYFSLLPSAAYAREPAPTLDWGGQDNVGARTTGLASVSTLINLDVYVKRLNGASIRGAAAVTLTKLNDQVSGQGTTKAGYLTFSNLPATEHMLLVGAPAYERATKQIDTQAQGASTMKVAPDLRRVSEAEEAESTVGLAVLAPNAQREMGKALEALRANKLGEARSHLDAAYRLAPTSAQVNYIFGVYSSQSNNLVQAKSYWTKALELDPKHLSALLSLSELLLREKKPAEALPLLKRATETEPSSWRSHALLSEALLLQGSRDEAIQQAERALELGHGPAVVIEPLLATALAGRGDTRRAISILQAFLKDHPADAAAKRQLESLQTFQVPVVRSAAMVTANQIGAQDITADGPQSSSWRTHAIFAEAYLRQGSAEEAIKEAEWALDLGQGQAAAVQPLLARALAEHGDRERAVSVLQTYIKGYPTDVAAYIQLESLQTSQQPVGYGPALTGANEITASALTAAVTSLPLPSNWLPPDVDERVPPVEPGTACALDDVLQKAGKRIQEFVTNVDRFTATESLKHESINKWGFASSPQTRKFDYVVSMEETHPGHLSVEEYRRSRGSESDFPDGVATIGLPALVLIFHPYNTGAFEVTCEGLARWNGALGWQVHFRQRSDKPNTIRSYRIANGPSYPVALRGRAWISADSYQILRLETDLIAPVPQIRLATDRTIIEYGPVHFRESNVDLWLPQSAELYYDWKGRRSHRRHSFSNYLLFSVGDKQRISAPKIENESASNPGAEEIKPNP
jgi:tetratricopeptide (TPR) repeat protein